MPDNAADTVAAPRPAVVGIGASAGGLAALRTLFSHLPESTGAAWVVVVHLSPEHESHLADILQPHVRFPVRQVTEAIRLEADHVYVIPPGANLNSVDTHLRLSELEEHRFQRAPVDHFFRTLAETHDGHSIGVILSGTGSDGSLGIKAIKERHGLTIVQDPDEAEYDGMPRSAISTGLADLVLPLDAIPEALLRYLRTEPRVPIAEEGELEAEQHRLLQKIFAQIRARTGRDFSQYKRSTILRRIQRRMQLRQIEELPAYYALLREDADEVRALADDMLINVTSFFRDPEVFRTLETKILPALFDKKSAQDSIRVWSVGCATGEEAYSLAMLLLEEATRRETAPRIQVFASDLHERSLERAREGFYPGDIETDVSEGRLRRFFHKEDGGYRIHKQVRELVVFAPHNLLADPPFSRLDLVLCRNVLIYLERGAQRDVMQLFHYALLPDGLLLVGSSETAEVVEFFRPDKRLSGLYRKRNVPAAEPRLPVFTAFPTPPPGEAVPRDGTAERVSYGGLHQKVVEQFAPPSLLVSPDNKVVHLSESAGRYLALRGGELTSDVFKLVREELRVELRAALHTARAEGRPIRTRPTAVDFEGSRRPVGMDVRPASAPDQQGFTLVIFDERGETDLEGAPPGDRGPTDARIFEVESELALNERRLQAVIEQYETGQEEMRASNEELQSANEELRSTLEELETSKEELQSMNEELQTVNQENRYRVEELAQLTSDLQNLLAATDIATLFLDRELRIMRFTPQVGELFNVRSVDRGRPLSDLTHRLGYDGLASDAEAVLRKLTPIEREVQDEHGRWYLTRVLPYRSVSDRIEGVVITFIEITGRKAAEEGLRRSEEFLRLAVEAGGVGTWEIDLPADEVTLSPTMAAMLGFPRDERTLSRGEWLLFVDGEDRPRVEEAIQRAAESGEPCDLTVRMAGADSTPRWLQLRGGTHPERSPGDRRMLGAALDVTEQKRAEATERARDVAEKASAAKSEFLTMMSHELMSPVAGILLHCDVLEMWSGSLEETNRLDSVDHIRLAAHHLSASLGEILSFSQLEGGRDEVDLRPTEVSEVVRQAVRIVEAQAAARGLYLQVDGADSPLVIRTDGSRLGKVVLNLLTNAVRYTTTGGVTVTVEGSNPRWLEISVRDTGPGIALEDQERIFHEFTQLDVPRADGGTGLGLAICRRLAGLLGGEIALLSSPGAGSTFTFRLPKG
jgi:two-component system, chemotaxis family, CheB/CheR fusion protein